MATWNSRGLRGSTLELSLIHIFRLASYHYGGEIPSGQAYDAGCGKECGLFKASQYGGASAG